MKAMPAGRAESGLKVKWRPPATGIADGPPLAGGARSSWGVDSASTGMLSTTPIEWDGLPWQVALSTATKTLWVMCADKAQFDAHHEALEDLAWDIAVFGGVVGSNGAVIGEPKAASKPDAKAPKAKARALSPKERTLALVTGAVREAYAAGADARDIRIAVFAAMGLDSEPVE